MIRMIIVGIFLALFFILGLIPMGIFWIIGRFNKNLADRLSKGLVMWAFRVVMFLSGVKLNVKGYENIPDVPVLYVSNHQSIFDIVVGYPCVKGLCGFVAKVSVKKVPILRRWMNMLHCLFMNRDDVRQSLQVILQGAEQIKCGISMWICPEGTRNKGTEDLQPFHDGSFKIGCAINPNMVSGRSPQAEELLLKHFNAISPENALKAVEGFKRNVKLLKTKNYLKNYLNILIKIY